MATKKKTEKPEPKTSKKEKKEAPKKSKKKVVKIEEDDEDVVDLDELVRARKKKDDTFKGNGHLNHCSCTGCGEPEGYEYAYGDEDEDEDDDECCEECCEDGDPVIVVFNKSENSLHGPFKEDELDEWLEEQEGNDDEIFIMTILNTARLTREWACEEVDTEELF